MRKMKMKTQRQVTLAAQPDAEKDLSGQPDGSQETIGQDIGVNLWCMWSLGSVSPNFLYSLSHGKS
jgi:hypothetical protein